MKQRVMEAWDHLEKQGKSLSKEAESDPKWFYRNFGKAMIPKDVDVNLGGTVRHEHGLTSEVTELLEELRG